MLKRFLTFLSGSFLGGVLVFLMYNTLLIEYQIVSTLPDGGLYVGERKGELFHGHGRLEWPNGAYYEGEFVNGKIQGSGYTQSADGSIYEGKFKDGMLHGSGTLESHGMTYKGEFKNDLFEGSGEQILSNGDRYIGQFSKGNYHGEGEYIAQSGERYIGEFINGDFSGQGTFLYADGSGFEGQFENWTYAGHGMTTYTNGDKYIGNFSEGNLNGPGEYIGSDGTHYKGDFAYGVYHGEGKITFEDGSFYKGQFENGSYHGKGKYTSTEGDVYIGQFAYGRYHGEGKLTYATPRDDITEISGRWRNGALSECHNECGILSETQIAEIALYNQNALINEQIASLKADSAEPDLYFLGIAGYGYEAVFRREVLFVKNYFDSQFGTEGRSLALVNDRSTVNDYPLATHTSVQRSLRGIADKMDIEEDILFVFLSSHGSKTHELSIEQPGIDLEDLSAPDLSGLINDLPVKWKVVVVSSCFSGGHIPYLENEHTLVITAADKDRESFGCSDENEFTYFGEAFFKDALPNARSFPEAFDKAKVIVSQKESQQDFRPSNPQINAPIPILAQLKKWRDAQGIRNSTYR